MSKKKELDLDLAMTTVNPHYNFGAYSIDFPEEWRQIIISLEKPDLIKNPDINLQTNDLKNLLSADIPDIARVNNLKANPIFNEFNTRSLKSWLIATKPIDTKKVCRIISSWLLARYGTEYTAELKEKFTPDKLEATAKELSFNISDGRYKKEYGGLPFCVIPQHIVNALVAEPIIIHDTPLNFFMNNNNATCDPKEIVSHPIYVEETGDWYSIVITVRVETRPHCEELIICYDVSTRRYISRKDIKEDKNGNIICPKFYTRTDINAMVVTKGSKYIVPIKKTKKIGEVINSDGQKENEYKSCWDTNAAACFNLRYAFGLPALEDVLKNPEEYVKEDAKVRILIPYSNGIGGMTTEIGTGVSAYDKEDVLATIRNICSDMTIEVDKKEIKRILFCHVKNLKSILRNERTKMNKKVKEGKMTAEERAAEIKRIRTEHMTKRFALCWGKPRVVFEIYGTAADKALKQRIAATIRKYLGNGNADLAVDIVEMDEVDVGNIIAPLADNCDNTEKDRIREIGGIIPQTPLVNGKHDIHMAFIILKNYAECYKREDRNKDPKKAIKLGLGRVHRLTQFITPDTAKEALNSDINEEKVEGKIDGAVLDAFRQLGFTDYDGSKDCITEMEDMTVIGLYLMKNVQYKFTKKYGKDAKKDIPIIIIYNNLFIKFIAINHY